MAVNTAYVSSKPENGSETAEKSYLPRMGTILSAKSLLNPIFLRAGSFDILLRDVRSLWKLQEFAFLLRSSLANTNETITKLVPSSLEIVPDSNDILGTKMAGEVLYSSPRAISSAMIRCVRTKLSLSDAICRCRSGRR